ncbi:MAG TPA: multiheme c-type cytochrome [Candidatus Krumholzibacteria bacterium]|nr:multiheme c-type cytochrome [Candidatus Krumholzibacteria bacterium]
MIRACLIALCALALLATGATAQLPDEASVAGKCMTCHKEKHPGLYQQWYESAHGIHNVTCMSCHQAKEGEPDAYEHYDATIATMVTPKDCGRCHEKEAEQVNDSYHAKAGQILDSADAYLAHVGAGHPAAIQGCESCHGAKMEIDPESPNKLSKKTWPNSGIGRINPDGSLGSCNACHTRHSFDIAQARQPESCGKCHLGPDHPQKEIYEESKHGNTYFTNREKMNLDAQEWVVGEDYNVAPTCATCHMSATRTQAFTHDVGDRIAWTNRPVISKHKENHVQKRTAMQDVCLACHGDTFADGHFYQYDASVKLYNEKFAQPAQAIMNKIKEKDLLETPAAFSNDVEWAFWELWHHEGRRARHGASMMGPDYTWWHGFYDVLHNFYFDFLPKAREYGDPEVTAMIDDLLQNDPMHQWVMTDTETLKRRINEGTMQEVFANMFDAYIEAEAREDEEENE